MSQNDELNGDIAKAKQSIAEPCTDAENIRKDITRDLRRSKAYPKSIKVSVVGNDVSLTGEVPSLQDKKTAEATASAEPGATHVKNDINIR